SLYCLRSTSALCSASFSSNLSFRQQQVPSLPPGPKILLLVGAMLDMPSDKEWITFSKWSDTWGDICSATVLGRSIIILGSAKVAVDLLDK
ncbi:hypothetical protein K438DRAFT_2042554, partial [Mycena galopus ATCC 62051]